MNSNTAIKVENLTKIYHLYDKPQDRLKEALNPFKKSYHNDFYALNDVSFEIKKGETVGIIGKNGAGKSTLLKIITGVLTPTSGNMEVNGKIASLLELGAGFNPEMTGLENIYLNGTLMGFTHEEMETKIDTILEFADIGEFIHQQVKTYSSGMFARLAFSVAINVEPDILIVDEALSVGDMRFQQKCIRKMEQFGLEGKTILFVSHDIGIINKFCNKAILLDNASILLQGETDIVTNKYFLLMSYDTQIQSTEELEEVVTLGNKDVNMNVNWQSIDESFSSFGRKSIVITDVSLYSIDRNQYSTMFIPKEHVIFSVKYKAYENVEFPVFGFIVRDRLGMDITGANSFIYCDSKVENFNKSDIKVMKFTFQMPYLMIGKYSISPAVAMGDQVEHEQLHWVDDAIFFDIVPSKNFANIGWYFGLDTVKIEESYNE